MKITITEEKIRRLIELAQAADGAETPESGYALEQYVDSLSPNEKCELLALLRTKNDANEPQMDTERHFEEVKGIPESDLNQQLHKTKFLNHELQDVLSIGLTEFEKPPLVNEEAEEE